VPIVDVIAGLAIAGAVVLGIRAGFSDMLALAGFAAGAVLGARVAPLALDHGQDSSFALVVALPAALLAGGLLAAAIERWRPSAGAIERIGALNAIGGGLLAAATSAVAVWLIAAVVVQADALRKPVERSTIVGRLDTLVEAPGPQPSSTRTPGALPIIAGTGPRIGAPDPALVRKRRVLVADRSVVEVIALGCGRSEQGSGWVAADGVIVTNAHVVVAARAIGVKVGGAGRLHPARAVWFDPRNDIAILRVAELAGVDVLPIVDRPLPGTAGVELGFPRGRHAIRAARLGRSAFESSERVGNLPVGREFPHSFSDRLIVSFRGSPEPGSSGGPVVDARGRVLTTTFGAREGRRAGVGVPNRFVRAALRRAGPSVSTGRCTRSSARSGG
jgi:S1-C subfamily serine protease